MSMSITTTTATATAARRFQTVARLSVVVPMMLALATAVLLAPGGAAAREAPGDWAGGPGGGGEARGGDWPGNGGDSGDGQPSAPAAQGTNGPLPVVIATDAVVAEDAAANPAMVEIIYAAAAAYGQPGDDMLRVAACESNLDPSAVNEAGGSYGLFQFIPSTWASTPFAGQDIFDPVASANAAAWMWSVGRRGEWVCQ